MNTANLKRNLRLYHLAVITTVSQLSKANVVHCIVLVNVSLLASTLVESNTKISINFLLNKLFGRIGETLYCTYCILSSGSSETYGGKLH